jgi:DNA-binding response OmpR family regulator
MRADHTILVVDDHPPTLYAATRLLRRAGFNVLEASTGEQALLLCDEVSALLLDVNLPDLNGVAVCEEIKRSSPRPVVLMSAVYMDDLHRSAGIGAGADLYVTSPLDGEQLARTFDQLLAAPRN